MVGGPEFGGPRPTTTLSILDYYDDGYLNCASYFCDHHSTIPLPFQDCKGKIFSDAKYS